jgi:hypothetical protein
MSKTIELSIPHKLSQDEARSRLQNGIADFRRQHGGKIANVEEQWTGNHLDFKFSVLAQNATGRVDVEPDVVKLSIDLPWLLAALAQKIRPQVEQEGRKLLE